MKVKQESEVAQSCPTLSDPMDCSLPGSSVHGIFQAGVLEWGAIAFSDSFSYLLPISYMCAYFIYIYTYTYTYLVFQASFFAEYFLSTYYVLSSAYSIVMENAKVFTF